MRLYRLGVALALVSVVSVVAGCTATERVIERSSVTIAHSESFSSLNAQTSYGNRDINNAIRTLTSSGFTYYDDTPELVRDESFGTMTVDGYDPLTITYSVNDDVRWSDGVEVDSADLLLAWAANSGALNTRGFDDEEYVGENGQYTEDFPSDVVYFDGQHNSGLDRVTSVPRVGADERSVTLRYDEFFADWQLAFSVGVPAHVVGARAWGMDDPLDAKDAVVEAIQNQDQERLAELSRAWNNAFNFTSTPDDESLLVSNGPYVVSDIVEGERVELEPNPEYTGDRRPVIENVIVETIADPLASVQALGAGAVDVIAPQPSAEVVDALLALDDVSVLSGSRAGYEHIDLQFTDSKSGHFDDPLVREAFLEVLPRQQIVDELIRPLQEDAVVTMSHVFAPGTEAYARSVESNGSAEYAEVDVAAAKQLLADAGVSSPEVCILFSSANPRRVQEFQLIRESAAEAGFSVTDCSQPDIIPVLGAAGTYDAALFGWTVDNLSTSTPYSIFHSTEGINNLNGYANPEVDELLDTLAGLTDDGEREEILASIDELLWADAYGAPLYHFPAVTAHNTAVEGVSPSPLAPGLFWNVWDWRPVEPEQGE